MPVRADAEQLHVDTTEIGEELFVLPARRLEIVGPHVGPEQPVGFEVDMAGEPLADECPVRLRVIGREADVLVEQHRAGSREGHRAGPMVLDQRGVCGQR